MNLQHAAYVHSFTAAGDRRWRAQCRSCVWHGVSTADKTRAISGAASHHEARDEMRRHPSGAGL